MLSAHKSVIVGVDYLAGMAIKMIPLFHSCMAL